MSNCSSSISESLSKPLVTYTWQVEHAQTPPQRSPSGAPARLAAARMVSPGSMVTSSFSRVNFTTGMSARLPAQMRLDAAGGLGLCLDAGGRATGQRLGDAAVHTSPGEGLGGLIQILDATMDLVVVFAFAGALEAAQGALDVGALFLVGQQLGVLAQRLLQRVDDALRVHP